MRIPVAYQPSIARALWKQDWQMGSKPSAVKRVWKWWVGMPGDVGQGATYEDIAYPHLDPDELNDLGGEYEPSPTAPF